MSGLGFPTRVLRSFFGPRLKDTRPIENPEDEVGERALNAAFDQIAGMNLISPRASVVGEWTGEAFSLKHQAEAWNIEGDQAHPTLARTATGQYTLTFASTYQDGAGLDVATALSAARVAPNKKGIAAVAARVQGDAWVDGLVVHVRLWDTNGDGVDAPFWLEVL